MGYPGAKQVMSRAIINQIPPHRLYVEPFLGTGVIMQTKLPALANVGIDRDPAMVAAAQSWVSTVQPLTLLSGDSLEWLRASSWFGDEFVYADPPYVRSARRSARDLYRYEMTDEDHVRLLDILCHLECPVMISGYHSELYDEYLSGWRLLTVEVMGHAGLNTECLWMNYPEPVKLHDYRFLGEDRTDRQRIKRKKDRWLAKLRAMPVLERRAILWALSDLESSQSDLQDLEVQRSQLDLQDIVDGVDCCTGGVAGSDYTGLCSRD